MTPPAAAPPRPAPTHCLRCENRIQERWDPREPICANCALERELFEREER